MTSADREDVADTSSPSARHGGFGRSPPSRVHESNAMQNEKGEREMNRAKIVLTASAMILAVALPTWAQTELPTHTVTLAGTVATIEHGKRLVTIKTADGVYETIDVPASAKRFDELKVGDKVSITYNNNVSVRPKPAGEPAVDTASKSSTMGQEERPGGTTSVQRTMTATVAAIDPNTSAITFTGPNGWKYSRHVVDPAVFAKVKVGDQVDVTWNTDLHVAVQ
jgi:hypothetical protein